MHATSDTTRVLTNREVIAQVCFLSNLGSIRLQGVEVLKKADRGSESRRPPLQIISVD